MNTTEAINEAAAEERAAHIAANPPVEEPSTLSAEEIHDLRRIIARGKKSLAETALKELPISEADRDRFTDLLREGVPYVEKLERYKGKLKVSFRTRKRTEEDALLKQLYQDVADGLIFSDISHSLRNNLYVLFLQIHELDGVPQAGYSKEVSLRSAAENSIFGQMAEQKVYILTGMLKQFEDKVSRLSAEAFSENFTDPATDS